MRAIRFLTIPLLSLGLSGCITHTIHQAQRQERLRQADALINQECENQGYRAGTELGLKCRIELTKLALQIDAQNEAAWQQQDQARRAVMLQAGLHLMNPPQPAWRPMNCQSYRQGVFVNTNCY